MKCPTWANRLYVPIFFMGVLQICRPSSFSATQRIGGHSSSLAEGFVAEDINDFESTNSFIVLSVSQSWGPLFTFRFPIYQWTKGEHWINALGMPWITWGSPIGNPAPEVQELRALVQAATVLDETAESEAIQTWVCRMLRKFVVMVNCNNSSVQEWDHSWSHRLGLWNMGV